MAHLQELLILNNRGSFYNHTSEDCNMPSGMFGAQSAQL